MATAYNAQALTKTFKICACISSLYLTQPIESKTFLHLEKLEIFKGHIEIKLTGDVDETKESTKDDGGNLQLDLLKHDSGEKSAEDFGSINLFNHVTKERTTTQSPKTPSEQECVQSYTEASDLRDANLTTLYRKCHGDGFPWCSTLCSGREFLPDTEHFAIAGSGRDFLETKTDVLKRVVKDLKAAVELAINETESSMKHSRDSSHKKHQRRCLRRKMKPSFFFDMEPASSLTWMAIDNDELYITQENNTGLQHIIESVQTAYIAVDYIKKEHELKDKIYRSLSRREEWSSRARGMQTVLRTLQHLQFQWTDGCDQSTCLDPTSALPESFRPRHNRRSRIICRDLLVSWNVDFLLHNLKQSLQHIL
ncbi:hypothetical protein CAPTEDRAFT_217036 [Capitella teleta]|uniref:Uncharacterized protein n=1 Tax=Capitella teleta TaxID=283909 RepID=R7UZB2_CAPTE|nr:hypothetical protein CAPTEDRAFT_217036 [Capitella teleta]|eukprot:ELU08761.1 hypothetical protein CAPTEDRAFT_217036 [Capitella teleta]